MTEEKKKTVMVSGGFDPVHVGQTLTIGYTERKDLFLWNLKSALKFLVR